MDAKLRAPEYAPIAQSLREIGFQSAVDLLSTYAGQPRDLGGWLKDAVITRDRDLRLQYLAGLGVNQAMRQAIYNNMLAYRKPPDNIFTGSDELKAWLWEAINSRRW